MAATAEDEARYRRERSEFDASGKTWNAKRAAEVRQRERDRQAEDDAVYKAGADDQKARTPSSSNSGRSTVRVRSGSPARTVVGTMAFAVLFALLSTEIERLTGTAPVTAKANPEPAIRVMIGGGVATIILVMVSTAGDAGAELAEGLALITLVTVVLVKGAPLWTALANLTGGKSSIPTVGPGGGGNPNTPPVVGPGQYGTSPTTMTNPPLTTRRTQ